MVIFLDVDGVLCNRNSYANLPRFSVLGERIPSHTFDPLCLALFENFLLENPAIELVLSSSWRGFYDRHIREQSPLIGKRLIGSTPKLGDKKRGSEIQAWLDQHPCKDFVILDDDTDMEHLLPFLIRTNHETGLTAETISALKEAFNGF